MPLVPRALERRDELRLQEAGDLAVDLGHELEQVLSRRLGLAELRQAVGVGSAEEVRRELAIQTAALAVDAGDALAVPGPRLAHGHSAHGDYPTRIHPTALKVQERLREHGLDVEVHELADSTRTAADAAAAVGCDVGQIVKSLVFRRGDDLVMCLCAGDRQVDTWRLGLERADADAVREATGFAIGGVPPLGHDRALPTLVDGSLRRFGTVWCAGGTPRAVFEVETERLLAAVGGDEF